jgi:hypothetical protein
VLFYVLITYGFHKTTTIRKITVGGSSPIRKRPAIAGQSRGIDSELFCLEISLVLQRKTSPSKMQFAKWQMGEQAGIQGTVQRATLLPAPVQSRPPIASAWKNYYAAPGAS